MGFNSGFKGLNRVITKLGL